MARYSDTLRDQNGAVIAGALVAVLNRDGATASLTDDDGLPLANPLTTDQYGGFYFNAPDTFYELSYYYGGRLILRDRNVLVGLIGLTGVRTIDGTSHTLTEADVNYMLVFTNNSPVTLTLSKTWPAMASVGVLPIGTGMVTFSPEPGATYNQENAFDTTYAQYSMAFATVYANADGETAGYVGTGSLV